MRKAKVCRKKTTFCKRRLNITILSNKLQKDCLLQALLYYVFLFFSKQEKLSLTKARETRNLLKRFPEFFIVG
ncbi:hypothetical protein CKF59_01545 [Psittacicella gerlachiana]|uniref:Uncharacterized protein n=1 Tax=Psittacicella gerlachiana TaxID=2028574 RepID=A0A3A1YND2_9GAMM|nr:hypothetical protein CKF59_01545 [Psittacicella gerlachiana]